MKVYLNNNGQVVAECENEGETAFYLKSGRNFIEKKFYEKIKKYTFKSTPKTGKLSVLFFFKNDDGNVVQRESNIYFYSSKNNELILLNEQVIVEEDDYQITYYDNESSITFITFNGARSTKQDIPFGFNFLLENGWNLINVAQDNNTQYQGLSLDNFYNNVYPLILNKKVFSYGSSLGGYCALYYGGIVDATIIAASPRNSAHPLIADEEWNSVIFNHIPMSEVKLSLNPVFIVYDSLISKDSEFISEIFLPYYSESHLLTVPGGSHQVLKCMSDAGVLKMYIKSIVDNECGNSKFKYIKAKCLYKLKKFEKAFDLIDDLIDAEFKFTK